MKKIYAIWMVMAVMLLSSCDKNGDSGYYEERDRIYFTTDSIICRLGEMPVDVKTYTVLVPLKVLGNLAPADRTFKMKVNRELTTAPDSYYTALPTEFVVDKDSVNVSIPVELLRSVIDPDVDMVYRVVLDLEENDVFGFGVQEKLQSRVVFSNYLQEPDWWYTFATMFWGPYQPQKYQKMMEIWGGSISFDDIMSSMVQVIMCAKEMYDYFQLHPEFGMEFPEEIVWPYE